MNRSVITIFTLILLSCFSLHAQNKPPYQHTKKEANEKCANCHDMREGNEFFHTPVKIGSCSSCHNIFNKTQNLLRIEVSPPLCTLCHGGKRRLLELDQNVHPPVKQDCTLCHDPHAGSRKFRLKDDRRRDLCLGCHSEKKEWINKVKNRHGAINLEDGGCIACHDPHSTTRPKMLKADNVRELCLSCHNKPLKRDEDGKMLLDMAKHLKENEKWHGPIVAGDCAGCHNPHGSDNHRMLKGPYPVKKSTVPFKPEAYFCFNCHETGKITEKATEKLTNFRKGTKNLHTVHVKNSSIVCGTCHEFHAVKDPVPLLKEKTNFWAAEFNLRYIKTPEGGSCNPICHNKREYTRTPGPKP